MIRRLPFTALHPSNHVVGACMLAWSAIACATSPASSDGGPTTQVFHGWAPIGDTTDVSPIPVMYQGSLYLFARRMGNGAIVVDASGDGRHWHGWRSLVGMTTSTPVAPVVFDGVLHIFVRSSLDNGIYETTTLGAGFSSWSRVPDITTDKAVSAAAFGGNLYLFAKGIDDRQIRWTTMAKGGPFGPWTTAQQTTDEAPAVAATDSVITYAWTSDGVVQEANSTDGTHWSDGTPLSSSSTSMTDVTAGVFERDLYVNALDASTGHIFSNMMSGSSSSPVWSGWFEVPPGTRATDQPAGSAGFKDGFYWFAKGLDDELVYETATPAYALPFDRGSGWSLASGNVDDPTAGHVAGYAFDFAHAEDGTLVRAMRDGHIVLWEDDETCSFFEDWQCLDAAHCCSMIDQDCSFNHQPRIGNLVMVRHEDGTVASYNHLAYQSIPEAVRSCGALVHKGDVLGRLGHTGLVCGPSHVHVAVTQASIDATGGCVFGSLGYPDLTGIGVEGPSLPIYFHDQAHAAWRPIVGDSFDP